MGAQPALAMDGLPGQPGTPPRRHFRQRFVRAHHEQPAGRQARIETMEDLPLQGGRKIGERQVSAENEIERANRHCLADVLYGPPHPEAILGSDAIAFPILVKHRTAPRRRQFPETIRRVTAALGARSAADRRRWRSVGTPYPDFAARLPAPKSKSAYTLPRLRRSPRSKRGSGVRLKFGQGESAPVVRVQTPGADESIDHVPPRSSIKA